MNAGVGWVLKRGQALFDLSPLDLFEHFTDAGLGNF